MSNKNFGFGTQIRKSPYFDSTVKWGATGFSVYNHMYIPRDFGSPEQNFWNLIEKSILCDVAVERQVEITGPDAYKFTQLLTPRDLSKLSVGQCKYVLIVNNDGGILNDPVLLRLAENHFWLSLADSDVLLWAQGVAVNSGLDVKISEPDVSPLQLQGPTSQEIMVKLFGEDIRDLKYYWLREYKLDEIPLIDYNENSLCKTNNSSLEVSGTFKNEMFVKYADHIRKMMKDLEINKTKLLDIINELFVIDGDKTRINKNLNETKLDKIIKKTREHLVKMYILCEKQYKQGLKIFDTIAEKLILDNTKKQINGLKDLIHTNLAN